MKNYDKAVIHNVDDLDYVYVEDIAGFKAVPSPTIPNKFNVIAFDYNADFLFVVVTDKEPQTAMDTAAEYNTYINKSSSSV
jgi:hypothetical protein